MSLQTSLRKIIPASCIPARMNDIEVMKNVLPFAVLLGLGGFFRTAGQNTTHAVCDGGAQGIGPHVDGVTGFVAHGRAGFEGSSAQEVDCCLFVHTLL